MIKCKICTKRWLCDKKQDEVCEKFEKEPYAKLVEVKGGIKIIERID